MRGVKKTKSLGWFDGGSALFARAAKPQFSPKREKKRLLRFAALCLCLAFAGLSCNSQINQPLQPASQTEREEELDQKTAPEPDMCWLLPACSNFCEDLFALKEERKNCSAWPISRFEKFKKLLDTMRFGLFKDIDPEALKLFLKETRDKELIFKKFTKDEAKEFLWETARNFDLASALWREDGGDLPIARKLFSKLAGRPPKAIKQPLAEGRANFLTLTAENHNRAGWLWLNGFVVQRCGGDSACEEPLDYYCEILEDISPSKLKEFFEESAFFKSAYGKAVQLKACGSGPCEYGPKGFREMCEEHF